MAVDRSYIRVKAMLIAPDRSRTRHAVSLNPGTSENPAGYHRLIGGAVELGETHHDAIVREVDEDLPLYPTAAVPWVQGVLGQAGNSD